MILQANLLMNESTFSNLTDEQKIQITAHVKHLQVLINLINTTLSHLQLSNENLNDDAATNPAYKNPLNTVAVTLFRNRYTPTLQRVTNWQAIPSLIHFKEFQQGNPDLFLNELQTINDLLLNTYNYFHTLQGQFTDIIPENNQYLQHRIEEIEGENEDKTMNTLNEILTYHQELNAYLKNGRQLSPEIHNLYFTLTNIFFAELQQQQQNLEIITQEMPWAYYHLKFIDHLLNRIQREPIQDPQSFINLLNTLREAFDALQIGIAEINHTQHPTFHFRASPDLNTWLQQNPIANSIIALEEDSVRLQTLSFDLFITDLFIIHPLHGLQMNGTQWNNLTTYLNLLRTVINELHRDYENFYNNPLLIRPGINPIHQITIRIQELMDPDAMEDQDINVYYQAFLEFMQNEGQPRNQQPFRQAPAQQLSPFSVFNPHLGSW